MRSIVAATSPTTEGEMLWCVHFKSSYYDNHPRDPGTVPVDRRFYVLANGRDAAIAKTQGLVSETRKAYNDLSKEEIDATIVTIESLNAARDCSGDGRLGFYSTSALASVTLSCPEDATRYRLGVCLIPI